jgi:hypothetical protein
MGFRTPPHPIVGRALLAFALLVPAAPAIAGSADPACDFRAATVGALFAAANGAEVAVDLLARGDAAVAGAALSAAAERMLDEKRRIAAEWRPHLTAREKKQLAKALKTARKRFGKAARFATRKPDRAALQAIAALEDIDATMSAQSSARAALGCEGGGELRVPILFVGAGHTRTLPAGTTIVAELGIEIRGTLAASGPRGGLTIEALSGDIVLDGILDGTGGAPAPGARAEAAAEGARAPGARGGAAAFPNCGDAGPVTVSVASGDLRVGPSAGIWAPSGSDCAPLAVTDWSLLYQDGVNFSSYYGARGGRGGSIRLEAPAGRVVFAPRAAGAIAPLRPGSGGAGRGLLIASTLLPPAQIDVLRVFGGDGGASGVVTADPATPILWAGGVPDRVYADTAGSGGGGGYVTWYANQGTDSYPGVLEGVAIRGGDGGTGIDAGGPGGDVFYAGHRVVSELGRRIADVTAVGGEGGATFGDDATLARGPEESVTGGHGGEAIASGHVGWSGDEIYRDGAAGSPVVVWGGNGGSIGPLTDGTTRPGGGGRGGNGGNAEGFGGTGGNGRPGACSAGDVEAGGDGGDGGGVLAHGGNGGESPSGVGGDGGSVMDIALGEPGLGGGGSPLGQCGDPPARFESVAGRGGEGLIFGRDGTLRPVEPTSGCGTLVSTCAGLPPDPDACGTPRWYRTSRTLAVAPLGTLPAYSQFIAESARERCTTTGSCEWIGHGVVISTGNPDAHYGDGTENPHSPLSLTYAEDCPDGGTGPAHLGDGVHALHLPTGQTAALTHRYEGHAKCDQRPAVCCRCPAPGEDPADAPLEIIRDATSCSERRGCFE